MLKKNQTKKIKQKIIESGIFDKTFYIGKYRDARVCSTTTIEHFMTVGIAENRRPNAMFDPQWYLDFYSDIQNSNMSAVEHFVLYGDKENRFISADEMSTYKIISESGLFHEGYYLEMYPDLITYKKAGYDLLLHFIRKGVKENRKPNAEFDPEWYLKHYLDVYESQLNPLMHYIIHGSQEQRFINMESYECYCEGRNHVSSEEVETQAMHNNQLDEPSCIIDEGKSTELVENTEHHTKLDEQQLFEYYKLVGLGINWSSYFLSNQHPLSSSDPITDYIKSWKKYEPLIPDVFDTAFYLASYPDIKSAGINPLLHYLDHGKAEGRIGLFDEKQYVTKGRLKYNPSKETIVFVSHESSASGAPLLGYNIADKLSNKYNIIHIVLKKSNIHDSFLDNCDLMLSGIQGSPYISSKFFLRTLMKERSIKSVLINSVVGYQVMYAAHELDLPILFLIHEFSEYMRPFGTMIDVVTHSDAVVVPATIIRDSLRKEFIRFANYKQIPSNLHIMPQGKLPYIPETYGDDESPDELYKKLNIDRSEEVKIIVASGWVQIRKGVDLFVATARYIKKLYAGRCKFVWVGDGFDPDNDLAYSIYLQREIEFSGLDEDFVFLEHQKNLDAIFSIADVFCLASRMDPFPNVVIDALSHDLHIACFDHGSGSAEFLRTYKASCTIADFVDTYSMAEGISNYLNRGEKPNGINHKIVDEYLNFDHYVSKLDELIDESVLFKVKSDEIVDFLVSSDEFEPEFFGGRGNTYQICRQYVGNCLKGIHFHNPKSGFSEALWMYQYSSNNQNVVPLYESLLKGNATNCNVIYVPNGSSHEILSFTYAVHLHLYYLDLADFFIGYFKNLPGTFDIFITIIDSEVSEKVADMFSECGARKTHVVVVENIGRDMGPLLFRLKEKLISGGYEVIGHFHSKKSLDLETGGGDKWLSYLMENLIGNADVATSVLSIFNDPKTGIIFPEDSNVVDIGENLPFITDLCEMMNLPHVEQTPLFPVGNMFWARLDAIKELFELDSMKILQKEPLPYDGSYMHAIERIIPHLVSQSGYNVQMTYKRGTYWK